MLRKIMILCFAGSLAACTTSATKSADVAGGIRQSLSDANLKDVSVSQDRDKGIVTLTGHTQSEADKARAESIAKGQAAGQIVADEIVVTPPGAESDAKTISGDVDKGIEKDLDAALVSNGMKSGVSYSVKAGVVTLSGTVNSQTARTNVERVAAAVPYVKQVVNTIQVKDQKATSRGGGH